MSAANTIASRFVGNDMDEVEGFEECVSSYAAYLTP
jgi:hypothetical protein